MAKNPKACTRTQRRLKAWLDGELDGAVAKDVERHVAACPQCRAMRSDFRDLSRLLRCVEVVQTPAPRLAEIRSRAMHARSEAQREVEITVTFLKRVACTAAAVIVSCLVVLAWPSANGGEGTTGVASRRGQDLSVSQGDSSGRGAQEIDRDEALEVFLAGGAAPEWLVAEGEY